ncbi:MAG: T9SS type A sorting domain-containing protein [Bacteroidetes bacterium]|nr:T9SS type A sorting domain-containing protein [Bacteroidota bacterium]
MRACLIAMILLFSQPGWSQWTRITGPDVATVERFYEKEGVLYAMGGGSLFKSTTLGESWELLTDDLPIFFSVSGIYEFNGDLIIGTSRSAYRKASGSSVWQEINAGIPLSGFYPYALNEMFREGDSLRAMTSRGPLTWVPSATKWVWSSHAFAKRKPNAFVQSGYLGSDVWLLAADTVLQSTDKGKTWVPATGFESFETIRKFEKAGGDTLFAMGNKLYRSTDKGLTWQSFMGDISFLSDQVMAVYNGRVFLRNNSSIFSSSSSAPVWTEIPILAPYMEPIRQMAFVNGVLFASFKYSGLWKSTDRGSTWASANSGMSNSQPLETFKFPGVHIFEFGDYQYWAWFTGSGTWKRIKMPYEGNLDNVENNINDFVLSGDSLYAVSGDTWVTTDWGQNWKTLSSRGFSTLVLTDSIWVATGSSGPEISRNRGRTWTVSNSGVGNRPAIKMVGVDGQFVAGTASSGVYRSLNGGQTWEYVNKGFGYPNGNSLYSFTYLNGYFYVTNQGAAGSPVFRSNDFSVNWTGFGPGLTNNGSGYMVDGDGNTLVYAGYLDKFAYRTDGQTSWTKYSTGLPEGELSFVSIVGKEIWVGIKGRGLFAIQGSSLPGVAVSVESAEEELTPGSLTIDGNYPNPFNPSTTIRFSVGSTLPVTAEIFSITGQRVAVLARNQVFNQGDHELRFDATGLGSGVYLVRVVAGNNQKTHRMMLVR